MTNFEIFILALAMSIDAFIVSFTYGLVINSKKLKNSIILGFSFGFFQFFMPLLGWYFVSFLYSKIAIFSKWLVFIIFVVLALKFIQSAFSKKENEKINCISVLCLISLSIATSIDAFGAGASIRLNNVMILKPSLIIGIVTFINSFLGFWISRVLKKIPSHYIEIMGAILLFYLAIEAII